MASIRIVKGKTVVEISKAEAAALFTAAGIVELVKRATGEDWKDDSDSCRVMVRQYGARHLDADGDLIVSPKEAAVNESAPEQG